MSLFSSFQISASGLSAERLRMDVIANNIANINTTRTPQGGPFRRQQVLFAPRVATFMQHVELFRREKSIPPLGVRVLGIVEDPSPPRMVYDPSHPDADKDGYVAMPNINIVKEMVDLISATRAYEANATALNEAKTMISSALDIGRG